MIAMQKIEGHPVNGGCSSVNPCLPLFYSLYILPAARINTNFVTWIDEERDVNNSTGFERCGLGDIVCSITTHSRFGALYPYLQEVGKFYRDNILATYQHLHM